MNSSPEFDGFLSNEFGYEEIKNLLSHDEELQRAWFNDMYNRDEEGWNAIISEAREKTNSEAEADAIAFEALVTQIVELRTSWIEEIGSLNELYTIPSHEHPADRGLITELDDLYGPDETTQRLLGQMAMLDPIIIAKEHTATMELEPVDRLVSATNVLSVSSDLQVANEQLSGPSLIELQPEQPHRQPFRSFLSLGRRLFRPQPE